MVFCSWFHPLFPGERSCIPHREDFCVSNNTILTVLLSFLWPLLSPGSQQWNLLSRGIFFSISENNFVSSDNELVFTIFFSKSIFLNIYLWKA